MILAGSFESSTTCRHSIHEEASICLPLSMTARELDSVPMTLYIAQHKLWYECIRSTVWERIGLKEDELPPSWEALYTGCRISGHKHAALGTIF